MIQTFKKLDRYTFLLSKYIWNDDDRITSKCINLSEENEFSFKGDVRTIWPEALKKYLERVFRNELYQLGNEHYKEIVLSQLREMYKLVRQEFNGTIKPRINYARPLFKHQIDAIYLMLQHRVNLLSFDMGLGKTITSATISHVLDLKRTCIIAPSGVKWNWYHDMCDDWGYNPMHWTILDAVKSRCHYAFIENFVVVNYENVTKHMDHLMRSPIDHFIIDEAHLLKNPTTQRFAAVANLVNKYPNARITMLTGTPITNRVNDMFSYYKLSGHLLGKNKSYFEKQYVKKSGGLKGKIIGAKNMDELRVRHSNLIIRKKTAECIDLPDLIINKYYMDEAEMSIEYQETLKQMYQNRIALQEAQESKSIRQLEGAISGNVHTLNRILATCKVNKVIELVDTLWEEGRKVIVFSGYTAPLELLEAHYKEKCIKIDGSISSQKRSILIEKYKTDKNCHVFLGQDQAAGVGINVVNSYDVIFMNFPFTPDRLEQSWKRSHRIGQKMPVNAYLTIVKNSIDEHIYGIINDKSKDINKLVDKNRKGTIDYETNVMDLVFNKLIDQYAKKNGLPSVKQPEFLKV